MQTIESNTFIVIQTIRKYCDITNWHIFSLTFQYNVFPH